MYKIIVIRMKLALSNFISYEQFGFLEGRLIHGAISIAQEGLHSKPLSKSPRDVVKLDLSKAYDMVSSIYIRLLIIHIGLPLLVVKWII